MADISIRERIVRQVAVVVGTATEIVSVERRRDSGNQLNDREALVASSTEIMAGGQDETATTIAKTFDVIVGIRLFHSEQDGNSSDEKANELIGQVVQRLLTNRQLDDGEPLAVKSWPQSIQILTPTAPGESGSGIRITWRVLYRHQIDDVGVGPGITQTTE